MTGTALVGPEHRDDRSAAASPLFRAESLEGRRAQWLGPVLLEPRVSHRVFAAGAALAALAVLGLLIFGSYTKKERVNGWLVTQQGVARIVAPQPGVVTKISVGEGAAVEAGAPLLVLSGELRAAVGGVHEEVIGRLRNRRASLTTDKGLQQRIVDGQARDLTERLAALRAAEEHLAEEIELQRQRLALSGTTLDRQKDLLLRKLVAVPQVERAQQDRLDQAARLQSLQRDQATLRRDISQTEGGLGELPLKQQVVLSDIDRNIAALDQELAQEEGRREIVITAPQAGIVTAIQTEVGGSVQPNVPLLSIVPRGSLLRAQLFSSGRSIGFVREGQRVKMRYQAFPYQKFGFYEGVVRSVSRSAISPSDMPQRLAGLSSLFSGGAPLYELTVELAEQAATVDGRATPLQPGMQVDADVLIERRQLYEWVLAPLFFRAGGPA